MAKKEEPKTVLERTYVIPLRRETLKVPPYRKAEKAITAVRNFIKKHMKSDNVLLGKYLNLKLWEHGMRNPPGKIKVNVTKDDKGKVMVEIFDAPKEKHKEEKKAPKKEEKHETKAEQKVEERKEEKAEEAKTVEQEEIKELQHEQKEQHPAKQHAPKTVTEPKQVEHHPPAPRHV